MRDPKEQHRTDQYFCGCAGAGSSAPVDLTAEGGEDVVKPAPVHPMQKIFEVPKHWTDPPPSSTKTKLNCNIKLDPRSDVFKEVEKSFRADLLDGFTRQYAMMRNGLKYHGQYINEHIRNDPLNLRVVSIYRVQEFAKYRKSGLEEEEISLKNGGVVNKMQVYHGTLKNHAFDIAEEGFSRFVTSVPGHGHGVYVDRHGPIAVNHALKDNPSSTGFILVCTLVYYKIGRTFSNDKKPPAGTDCGGCCTPSNAYPVPCILVSFRDDQLLVKYILEFEWTGRR